MKNRNLLLLGLMVLAIALLFSGCSSNTKDAGAGLVDEKTVDIKAVKAKLDGLTFTKKDGKEENLFSNVQEMSSKELKDMYGIDTELMREYMVCMNISEQKASMYMILLPAEGKANIVKSQLDKFTEIYGQQWEAYFPEEKYIIDNKLQKDIGNYIIYIISNDNDKALKAIEN